MIVSAKSMDGSRFRWHQQLSFKAVCAMCTTYPVLPPLQYWPPTVAAVRNKAQSLP